MGDSTEKNLKSYRNSELKWFLLANILLMLVTSGGLKFDSQDANVFSFISEIISITAVSSCAYILTFIFDSILPPIFKVKLIFGGRNNQVVPFLQICLKTFKIIDLRCPLF